MTRRKRLTSIGLAVAMTAPGMAQYGQWHFGAAEAASTDSQSKASNADLLKQGISQYDNGSFEDAVTTLQQVDAKSLSDADRSTLVDTLAKADAAATQRKAARAELERGEDARKAGRMVEAGSYYQAVLANNRADDATRARAQAQLSLVQAAQKVAQSDAKVIYDRGREEYKKGDWIHARADFNKAKDLGYTGGFLEASPSEYLQKIDDGEKAYMEQHEQEAQQQKEEQHKEQAHSAYERGRDEYRSGDWKSARKDFVMARDLGYQPGFLEGLAPGEYLSRMDEKEAQDAQAVAQQRQQAKVAAATAPVPVPVMVAANKPADTSSAPMASASSSASSQTVNYAGSTQTSTAAPANDQDALQRRAELDKVAAQQHVFKAQTLVAQGKQAEQSGNEEAALRDYQQAVVEDPTNSDAVQGRDRLQAKLGRTPTASGGGSILTQRQQQINQVVEAINYKFDRAIKDSRTAIAGNDFVGATNSLADAQNARDEDPTAFTENDLRRMDATIGDVKGELAAAQRSYAEQAKERAQREIANSNRTRLEAEARERQATIASLIKLSRSEIQQQNYEAALGVLDQILRLDPQNDYALGVRQLVEDKAVIRAQRKYREQFDSNFAKQLNKAQEAQIPFDDILTYPDNWPDLSEMRDTEAQTGDVSKEDQETQVLLNRRLPQMSFNATALSDAIDFLHDTTGANILVNWKALEAASIDKQTPITASLRDVKFSKVLDIVLDQAGSGKLAYTIDDGVITISTTDDLNKATVIKVYDIRDLLMTQTFTLTAAAGGGLSSQAPTDSTSQLKLIEGKIQNLVEPTSWKGNDPNAYGQIDDFQSMLLITQTNSVHQKIDALLAQLRENRSIQITIECRFLSVERNFLDDVGVDFGLTLNAGSPNHWSPIAITQSTSSFTASPTNPSVAGSITESGGEGLTVANNLGGPVTYGNFLDDVQVGLLLTAVQLSQRSSIVHAPRVTMQDGMGATMIQQTTQPYVSNVNTTVTALGSSSTESVATTTDGVSLSISQAVVSADHKYVTMDLNPSLNNLIEIVPFVPSTASVPATSSSSGNGVTVVNTQALLPATTTIQEPITQTTAVATRVTVPDGGTILLGGVTVAAEVNREAGVPILSKIPFLKRLTTNTSMAKDELVLVILVKPTVVINREIEAKSFPLLSASK